MNLYKRNLLTLLDYSPEEIEYLLNLAKDLKEKSKLYINFPNIKCNKKSDC